MSSLPGEVWRQADRGRGERRQLLAVQPRWQRAQRAPGALPGPGSSPGPGIRCEQIPAGLGSLGSEANALLPPPEKHLEIGIKN